MEPDQFIGRREAFAAIAARCTAAEAQQLRTLRDQKLYLSSSRSWKQFCRERLHISRSNADRLIALLDEFGPAYFAIAQFTRISPEIYRELAPALQQGPEPLALIPENARRIAAAADAVRDRHKLSKPVPTPIERLAAIVRRMRQIESDFLALRDIDDPEDRSQMRRTFEAVQIAVHRIGRQLK